MTASSIIYPPPRTIRIEDANPSWKLIMQSGVGIDCTIGIPVGKLLTGDLGISEGDLARVDAILLDGMPVDDVDLAVVPDGARLALAAGLPGIAGLAMKRGSAVRALRGGITHTVAAVTEPGPGTITLLLYSLTLRALAAHFLRRGVFVRAGQVRRYAAFAPDDRCFIGADGPFAADSLQHFVKSEDERFLFFADIPFGDDEKLA